MNSEAPGLFKYLAPSEEKLFFFEKSMVMVTPPLYLNDPWDFLPRKPKFTKQEMERLKANNPGLTNSELLAKYPPFFQREISKICGIVSLTEKPLCRLMWAHYAESHAGFVAEFDAPDGGQNYGRMMRASAVGPAIQVGYSPQVEPYMWDETDIFDACCTKHADWKYEQEWRVILPLDELPRFPTITRCSWLSEQRICWSFEPSRLRRVILGMRMKPVVMKRLLEMLRRNDFKDVKIQTTAVDPETGELIALEANLNH
ncbi:MAG: DUF2971 domain-containing protein [Verrucomicrobiota bacterium]